jgi:hypothetical protein
MHSMLTRGLEVSLKFIKPAGLKATVRMDGNTADVRLFTRDASGRSVAREAPAAQVAIRQVVELRLPFRDLGVRTHTPVAFIVALNRGEVELEHHPRHRPIEFEVPDREFAAVNWTA